MSRIRIFVSFDGEHDADLNELLQAQSTWPGASFEFSAQSQSGAMTDTWTATSRNRIRAADEVVVICGEHTDASPRVAAELRIAQEEDRPYFLLWGRRGHMCTKPTTAKRNDGMYSWTWEIFQSQVRSVHRADRSSERVTPRSQAKSAPKTGPQPPG